MTGALCPICGNAAHEPRDIGGIQISPCPAVPTGIMGIFDTGAFAHPFVFEKPASTNLRDDLANASEMIRRDFGRYGHHSRRCVRIPVDGRDEFVCADDCRMIRRAK